MTLDRSIIDGPIEKKLYQLIIGRMDGYEITNPEYQDKISCLVRNGIGGFVLFGGLRDEVRRFIMRLQALSEHPLLIASDIERGVGQQVQGSTVFPCQMAMAAAIDRCNPRDVGILEETIQAIAAEAGHVGVNMPLIPVLDVNQEPDNPIICTRAFSDDPEIVAWFGMQYIKNLEEAGLVSCAKHFPGHGDTSVDSHLSLPVIRKSFRELMSTDVVPFSAAISQGVSSIMVGHLSIPAVDSVPASLSLQIHEMLRSELGFQGVILTDALTMSALDDIHDPAVRCLNAGADILLHPADPDETVRTLLSAVYSGQLQEGRIDGALTRIMHRKEALQNPIGEDIDYHANAILSSRVTDKSITLIKKMPGVVPLEEGDNVHIVIAGDQEASPRSPLRTLSPYVRMLYEDGDYSELRNATVIVAIFTSIAAWKGSAGLRHDEKQKISKIISGARKSIVLSFGNPYVLRYFRGSDVLIAAYEATDQAQRTVVKWLKESGSLGGKIPVRLS